MRSLIIIFYKYKISINAEDEKSDGLEIEKKMKGYILLCHRHAGDFSLVVYIFTKLHGMSSEL